MSDLLHAPRSLPPLAQPALQPVVRRTLTDDVLLTLRKAIVAGAFAAGDHIPEARMAKELGVSRVPVREAMMALEREGLLAFDPRGAARVREFAPEDFEEIFTMRLTLEPVAARKACQNLRPEDVTKMQATIEQMNKTTCLLEVTLLDVEFHDLVVQAGQNQLLYGSWVNLRSQLQLWMARLHRHQGNIKSTRASSVRDHLEIVRVLQSRDGEAASERMHQHLVSWRECMPQSSWEGNVV